MVKIGGSGSYSTITLLRRRATNLLRFANNEGNDLSVIKHFLVREQNFIMTNGADIVQTGNIFGEKNCRDAGHGARGRCVAPQNFRMRVRRTNRPDFEHPCRLRDVIDVNRFAGDVFVRALVRMR